MGTFLWPSVTPSLPRAGSLSHAGSGPRGHACARFAPPPVNEYDSHYRFHSRGWTCAESDETGHEQAAVHDGAGRAAGAALPGRAGRAEVLRRPAGTAREVAGPGSG